MATRVERGGVKEKKPIAKVVPTTPQIRQPIVTVAGHVDHGKTTLLDSIRGTCVAAKEAGAITQKISFTLVPASIIKKRCSKLLEQFNITLEIPGFLFIDTPGHAAFTNLRKRGGALADLAILVVDINEGIMEQTRESIEVLKENKVPFIVALNKIDNIAGWTKRSENLVENIEKQAKFTKDEFDKKFYKIINDFTALGFDSDLFYRIRDFTKQLALVPCSAKTCEGLPELIVMLAGLAQKFLKGKLVIGPEGKGTILEIKKEKGFTTIEAILYDGTLERKDSLIIATLQQPVETKIRALFEALPLGKGFESCDKVIAASGVRLYLPETTEIVPGMPFVVIKEETKAVEVEKLKSALQKEVQQQLKLDKEGIIAKADSLGSLEALLFLLRKEGIKVKKAEIGNIKRQDIALAVTNIETDPMNAVIVGFNVTIEPETIIDERVKIIGSDVIYHIIEELLKWRQERSLEIEREKLEGLAWPCKIKVLRNCCFRQSKPAIFGIRIEAGILKPGTMLLNEKGEEIDKVKGMQLENKSIEKATAGMELAISLPRVTFGRQVKEDEVLYVGLTEDEFRKWKENKKYLSASEIKVLQEIAEIKRKSKATWGI
ncbi:MAG: translation initiation factor IF-2 [Candidatus Pacearchaeota archaeon]|nr:translation initiation factor IF-2 [Candidatus Pacearchaeota archaeon]